MEGKMDFGDALGALRSGMFVTRAGWNGKGMYLAYRDGATAPVNEETARQIGVDYGTSVEFLPYIAMRTVSGAFVPWLASQTDMLADDWQIA